MTTVATDLLVGATMIALTLLDEFVGARHRVMWFVAVVVVLASLASTAIDGLWAMSVVDAGLLLYLLVRVEPGRVRRSG